jgi:hypothetical protein
MLKEATAGGGNGGGQPDLVVYPDGPFCTNTGRQMYLKNNTGRTITAVIHRGVVADNRDGDFNVTVGPQSSTALGCTALEHPLATASYAVKSHN